MPNAFQNFLNHPMQLLDYLFECNKIPVWIMDNQKRLVLSIRDEDAKWPIDFAHGKYHDLFRKEGKTPVLCTFNNMEMYASFLFSLEGTTYRLLAGPAFLTHPFSQDAIQLITFYNDISREQLERRILSTPVISLSQFAGFIRLLLAAFSDQDFSVDTLVNLNISKTFLPATPDDDQSPALQLNFSGAKEHASQELLLLNTIQSGNVEAVEQLIQTYLPEQKRYFSRNPLKQSLYHFVGVIALISRFAINGGLDEALAYHMHYLYIQKAESCQNPADVTDLLYTAAKDFASRVKGTQANRSYPKAVLQCIEYIRAHLHEPISLKQLAESANMNAAYLSVLFKQKTGVPLAEYIQQQRISEAKSLLRFTDSSLLEISQRLSFSSQSYFASVFKKYAGVSPKQYRTQYYKQRRD